MKATFKVHKVDVRDLGRVEIITLHPLDPHEKDGANDFVNESRSGDSKIKLKVDAKDALGKFAKGQLVTVDIQITADPSAN